MHGKNGACYGLARGRSAVVHCEHVPASARLRAVRAAQRPIGRKADVPPLLRPDGVALMDPAFFSAFAALAGSAIGGATSLGASWLTQRAQFRVQQYTRDLSRREDLYRGFIEEASRLYADAYENDCAKVTNLVNLYALISRMRVLSSPAIVQSADEVARVIIETYRAPN